MKSQFLPSELPVDKYNHHLRMCQFFNYKNDEIGYKYIFKMFTELEFMNERKLLHLYFYDHIKEMEKEIS